MVTYSFVAWPEMVYHICVLIYCHNPNPWPVHMMPIALGLSLSHIPPLNLARPAEGESFLYHCHNPRTFARMDDAYCPWAQPATYFPPLNLARPQGCLHTYTYTCSGSHICVCLSVGRSVGPPACVRVCMRVCARACVRACVCHQTQHH